MELKREIRRKTFHLTSSLIPLGYLFLGRETALIVMGGLIGLAILLEAIRMTSEVGRKWIHKVFDPIMRVTEENKISGATYLLFGAWAAIYLFEKEYTVAALLMLTLSDTAAALVGVRYGKIKLWKKSLEGSIAFFVTSVIIIVLVPGLAFTRGILGAVVGTLTEVLPIPLNDNLTVPLFTAAAMQFLM